MVFGVETCMFDSHSSSSDTKVAVTATTIKDAMPYIFCNYNGVEARQKESGYQHVRPVSTKDEPCVWEVGRATSAAPMLFRPIRIPGIGTFQDGGLKHNNPTDLGLWESRIIWPMLQRPDAVVSLGTGMAPDPSTPTAPNFRHVIFDGFIPRLWRSFMSSLDGQNTWRDLWNRLDSNSKQDYFRLNVKLNGERPAMDDVSRMEELRELVQSQDSSESRYEQTAFALLVSTFFFELNSMPLFYGGLYYCRGNIRCRLPGKTLCEALQRMNESRLVFMTDDEIVGHFLAYKDLCVKCKRYDKDVDFTVRHPGDAISIYLQSPTRGKRRLSAFPQSIDWFIRQQHLEVRFARVGRDRIPSCADCRASKRSIFHSAMPKRKMTEHHTESSGRRKRQRTKAAPSPWDQS
ncbi:hypothetical protein ACLMJK_001360 [Lecanora helva]